MTVGCGLDALFPPAERLELVEMRRIIPTDLTEPTPPRISLPRNLGNACGGNPDDLENAGGNLT